MVIEPDAGPKCANDQVIQETEILCRNVTPIIVYNVTLRFHACKQGTHLQTICMPLGRDD